MRDRARDAARRLVPPVTLRLAIATAPRRNSVHWEQGTIEWDEVKGWLADPATKKEAGNYVFGTLKETPAQHPGQSQPCLELHRRKDALVSRSAVTLDVDHPEEMFSGLLELTFPYRAIAHTTYSSSPGDERYRVIVPTDREMLPDEYIAVSTQLMRQLGEEQFDRGSSEPERYMFRPAAQKPEWFQSWVIDGPLASVDALLDGWDWDLSSKPFPRQNRTKRDPFTIDGTVGAFNRAYQDWDLLIDEYELPYERADGGRWHLIGARSVAGMGEIEGSVGLVYSHHAGDPAFGRACSAFDLVRLHRFGEMDEGMSSQTPVNRLPSHEAMLELAAGDPRVIAELVGVEFDADGDGDADPDPKQWLTDMRRNKAGTAYLDTITNWDLIKANDPVFTSLRFNALEYAIEMDPLPEWRVRDNRPTVGASDRSNIYHYVEREYGIRAARSIIDEHIDTAALSRPYQPIRDWLESLEWDGVPRVETALPGVVPTSYTRTVACKALVAAVARQLDPGIKWDHTLVLYGSEGLGKSYWIDRMSRGYSAGLGRIGDKDTLLTMQRSWIMVADEGHSLRKADSDVQKEFLTRTEDVFRAPYDRDTLAHKRHCVIWSTTNDKVFLRRQEGNRRFLIVHCERQVDFDELTDEYIAQVWAEAVHLYRAGETLFLSNEESYQAREERELYTEEDSVAGLIEEYLKTLKPENWKGMSIDSRVLWLRDRADGLVPDGVLETTELCTTQIWVEVLGRRIGEHRRVDLLEISESLKRMGWEAGPKAEWLTPYGAQKVFRKRISRTG